MTPYQIKPRQVVIPVSEHVPISDEGRFVRLQTFQLFTLLHIVYAASYFYISELSRVRLLIPRTQLHAINTGY